MTNQQEPLSTASTVPTTPPLRRWAVYMDQPERCVHLIELMGVPNTHEIVATLGDIGFDQAAKLVAEHNYVVDLLCARHEPGKLTYLREPPAVDAGLQQGMFYIVGFVCCAAMLAIAAHAVGWI